MELKVVDGNVMHHRNNGNCWVFGCKAKATHFVERFFSGGRVQNWTIAYCLPHAEEKLQQKYYRDLRPVHSGVEDAEASLWD